MPSFEDMLESGNRGEALATIIGRLSERVIKVFLCLNTLYR